MDSLSLALMFPDLLQDMQHSSTNLAGEPPNESTPLITANMGFLGELGSPTFEMLSSAQPSPALIQHADNVANWVALHSPALQSLNYGPLISPALGFVNPFQTKHWNTPADVSGANLGRNQENALFTPLIDDSVYDGSAPLITDADQVFYSPADLMNITLNSPSFYIPTWGEQVHEASKSLYSQMQPNFQDCMGSPLVSGTADQTQAGDSLMHTSINTPLESASVVSNSGDIADFLALNPGYHMSQYQEANFNAPHYRSSLLSRRSHLANILPKPFNSLGSGPYSKSPQFGYPSGTGSGSPDCSTYVSSPLGANFARSNKSSSAEKEKRRFVCEFEGCGLAFTRLYNKKTHQETHYPNRVKAHPCTECSRRFDRKHDLGRHLMTVHRKERTHTCQRCAKTFTRSDALLRHMDTPDCTPLQTEASS